jgi:glutaredoxin
MVTIYGKDSCPYTRSARDEYESRGEEVEYVNVRKDQAGLQRMLVHSRGRRVVPVIVETDGRVTIGFDGGT